jgi:ABC-type thiamine transport system ATPase subunit
MKRDDLLLLITVLTLAELTLVVALAYRIYLIEQPQIAQLQSAGSGISGLLNLITGKKANTNGQTPA